MTCRRNPLFPVAKPGEKPYNEKKRLWLGRGEAMELRWGKKAAALLLAGVLALLAPACGESQGDAGNGLQPSGEIAHIVYYDTFQNFEATDKIVNAFNLQSAATRVSVCYLEDGTYDESIRLMLDAGSDTADCFFIGQASESNQMASAGLLANLSGYVHSSQLNVANYGSAIDIVTLEEQLYSLPMSKNAWMLFYNKDYFDGLDEPYPGQLTWEEYADLALRMTYMKDWKKYWGGFIPPWTLNIGSAAAGEYLTDDELPLTREYVELLNRLYNVDESHPGIFTMQRDYGEPYGLFEKGQIAMMIHMDSAIPRLKDDANKKPFGFEWDIAPLPVFDFLEEGTTVGNCTYVGVSAFSEHPENAFEFAAFFCGEEGAVIMAENATCPAYLMDLSAQVYLSNADVPGARYFFESNILSMESPHPLYEEMNLLFEREINLYLADLKDLDAAFDSFYQGRKTLLEGA